MTRRASISPGLHGLWPRFMLTERSGQIVSREEIHQHIWSNDTVVDFETEDYEIMLVKNFP